MFRRVGTAKQKSRKGRAFHQDRQTLKGPQTVLVSFKIIREEKNFQIKGSVFICNINIFIFIPMQ